jgi:hypothetical protein
MIMPEENTELGEFLKGKNLPLDLKVEILDHISEQINFKMVVESKDFPVAFAEIKQSWKEDLLMKKTFFGKESRTKIHRKTVNKIDIEILKKSGFYFAIYFILNTAFIFYDKTISSNFIFGVYSIMTFIFLILVIFKNKIFKTTFNSERRKISYLQQGTAVFTVAGIFIPIYVLYDFDIKFASYYSSIFNLINYGGITITLFVTFFMVNVYALGWIYGFLYFLEYKKSLKMLEQKINFKL